MNLFSHTAFQISERVTKNYSSSFYLASRLFDKETRKAIFSIYGFVRFADEIVDTFHEFNKEALIEKFEYDYYQAIADGISLNPILQSFQETVKKYSIKDEYIQAFLQSMKADLSKNYYSGTEEMKEYIYGSADVVGLMCLKVFVKGDVKKFALLEQSAMKLGSAFQKVNFLRDLKNDLENLNRQYFPNVGMNSFNDMSKKQIIEDIENDFKIALTGIKQLPKGSKLPVFVAYFYYHSLLRKIKRKPTGKILKERIRISNARKLLLIGRAIFLSKLNLIG